MLKITKVKRNSIAKELGLEVGDEIVAFDNHPCEDELDYLYYCETDSFSMTVRDKRSGEETTVEIEKDEGETLGVEFEKNTAIRTCHNRCVFCFVDQMPKGMRESLYVKDDDYSMSFSCGNFVTLTNLSDEGLERIIRLQLSPLYVSVHTMNPELRVKLLRNRHAGKIVEQIDKLAKGGIKLHCQAVLVPNENDGEELCYTARQLFQYYPAVQDLACVPTGITKYREGLYPILDVDGEYSKKLLDTVDKLNAEFGVPFLLPADEYFVKAGREFKPAAFYGDFEQIENGIGMTSKFLLETNAALEGLTRNNGGRYALKKEKRSLLISGVSAETVNKRVLKECEKTIAGLTASVLAVKNRFFGETVTCTGLLTGQDILAAVREYKAQGGRFDEIVLPGNTMKEFEDVFLCGMTLDGLKKELGFENIRINREGGYGLVEILST
ncbi:MAG: DUF512 domain-containing protein [Clostridiales bacterium]|nr:DUF512 domain-containing protein [Clostridiales bacterium]